MLAPRGSAVRAAQVGFRRVHSTRPLSTRLCQTGTQCSKSPSQDVARANQAWKKPTNLPHKNLTARPMSSASPLSNAKPARVTVPIDGTNTDFSALLLRDACSCPRCVHEHTNQRLFSTADIPATIQAREVDVQAETVNIKWKNDAPGFDSEHKTTLDLAALRQLSQTGSLPVTQDKNFGSPVIWGEERLELPDYDYETYLKDDQALYQLMHQLHTVGLAFVTNIPGKETSLATIATRMGPIKDTFYGQTWDVRTVPQAINAAYTSSDLGFHTDLLYFQQPPHIQLLHCIQSASTGGASVFADAFKAAIELFQTDVDAFETLATVPVNYHYNHPNDNVYRTTKPVIDLNPLRIGDTLYTSLSEYKQAWHTQSVRNGGPAWNDSMLADCLDKINWGPPFLAPFSREQKSTHELVSKAPVLQGLNEKAERWHDAAIKFNKLLQRPSYLYERKMNPGECVLFNNTRTLHSRRAFDSADVGKPRWLRGTYVDKDPFFSQLRVLKNKFE